MNPSVVPHPDQSGLRPGCQRIIISLRAVGEGHISSIAFREAILTPRGGFALAPEPPFATAVNSIDDEATSTDGPVEVCRHVAAHLSRTGLFSMPPQQKPKQ